ncbi:MAG: apolipoprotein N-acyltransferase [Proteobacteria bacterium]|nr:apolipoprotein N-acyltransferase [Pseudomonadota bacterium]
MIDLLFPAILACAGAWFGFANPWAHVPPMALLLPIGLLLAAQKAPSPKSAFKRGWLIGAAAFAGSLYWIALPVHDFGQLPWVLAVPCPILIGLVLGLYHGLFCLGIRLVKGRLTWPMLALWAGSSWWLLELLRGVLLTGFPWLTLASAFSPWPFAIQAAAIVGSYGLSGMLTTAAILLPLGTGLLSRQRLAGTLILALLAATGFWTLSTPLPETDTASVLLIQGNIDQSLKWDETYRNATLARYETLTRGEALRTKPDLIIWPETALPFYLQNLDSLSLSVRNLAKELGTPILTGSPAFAFLPGQQKPVLYNRAYLVEASGQLGAHYDKEHLVPFGEYIPFGQYLPFVTKLVQGVGDFVPGDNAGPLPSGALRSGVLLCYETIFPALAQNRVASGSNLLVNISNDAWFGRSSAPIQHLHLSVLRAVEQRRSIARCTNTGISAFIDPQGHIRSATQLFRAAAVTRTDVPVLSTLTFFHRHYDLMAWLPAILLVLCALPALLMRPRD